jgi:hypothetical protein
MPDPLPEDAQELGSWLQPADEASTRRTVRYGSGRSLTMLEGAGDDRLIIASATGRVELLVRLTPDGPRLEFDSDVVSLSNPGALELECERFVLRARGAIDMSSDADIRVRGAGNVAIDGEMLELNCEPRGHKLVPRPEG